MDSEHWISRLAAAKRYYAAQLGHVDDMPGMGMEEVEMEMEDDGDMEMEMALELGGASWPDVACPYCYEDHDVASLCIHLEEDHPYEPHAAVSQPPDLAHELQDSLLTTNFEHVTSCTELPLLLVSSIGPRGKAVAYGSRVDLTNELRNSVFCYSNLAGHLLSIDEYGNFLPTVVLLQAPIVMASWQLQ